jgi:hypothetical protein
MSEREAGARRCGGAQRLRKTTSSAHMMQNRGRGCSGLDWVRAAAALSPISHSPCFWERGRHPQTRGWARTGCGERSGNSRPLMQNCQKREFALKNKTLKEAGPANATDSEHRRLRSQVCSMYYGTLDKSRVIFYLSLAHTGKHVPARRSADPRSRRRSPSSARPPVWWWRALGRPSPR